MEPTWARRRRPTGPQPLRNLSIGIIFVLIVMSSLEICRHEAEAHPLHRRFPRKAYKLCSQNLSDAMQILCKDRGYNEPFASSESNDSGVYGPGLANECCRNSCTLEQMEQYCKPLPKA